jgi:hypothetical protein
MSRLLKPGGFSLVTATPLLNLNGYALINKITHKVKISDLAQHKQSFHTSTRLQKEFSEAGFSSVEVHGVYIGPVNWIARLFPTRLPAVLKKWESLDETLADKSVLRELSNMFLIKAVK